MATATINRYNHTYKKLLNQEITYSNLKLMLRNNTTFTATNTVVSDLDGTEESGNGWTAGGETLTGTVAVFSTNGANIDAPDITVTASGGTILATDAVIIDDTDADPEVLWHLDFGATIDADDGTDFVVTIPANGITTVT